MKLRYKETKEVCHSGEFNIHGIGEIIVCFEDGGADSDYLTNYDVYLTSGPNNGKWSDLAEAFKNHDVIRNNYNTRFFEPKTEEDRKRGYTL